MTPDEMGKLAVNYGLGILLSIAIAVFLGWLLKYVLDENSKREERLAQVINKDLALILQSISNYDVKASEQILNLAQVHRHQREEHDQQREAYKEIKEENDRRREAQEKIVAALNEINRSLIIICSGGMQQPRTENNDRR